MSVARQPLLRAQRAATVFCTAPPSEAARTPQNTGAPGGAIFSITTGGSLTPLLVFDAARGFQPMGELIQPSPGRFVGTAARGGSGLDAGVVFRLTVASNHPPVLNSVGNKSVGELSSLTFTATASDPDSGDSVTFSVDAGAPAGAAISSGGVFSWTPTEAQGPGTYSVGIRVSDNGAPVESDSETISIHVNEVNSTPVLAPIGNKSVKQDSTLTFTASATDPDLPRNILTFSLAAGAPAGATINSTSGAFSWKPSNKQGPGNYPVTIRVTDNGSPVRIAYSPSLAARPAGSSARLTP